MKRFVSAILICALLLTLLPAVAFAGNAAVIPVVPGEGLFTFTKGGDWGVSTGWQSGSSETEGLWLQSSSADGASAGAAYIEEKLSGDWYVNAQLAPQSTTNSGRAVCKLQLLDRYKNPKVILTFERLLASKQLYVTWQALEHADGGDWVTLWKTSDWVNAEDTAVNVRIERTSATGLRLTLIGDEGYTKSADATVAKDVMDVLCYMGFFTEKTTARLSNLRLGEAQDTTDYQALAQATYQNLMKNFMDTANNRLYPVTYGYKKGTVTNTGMTFGIYKVGAMWESVILLMAMDTYAQTLNTGSEEYTEVSRYIANTVKMFTDGYIDDEITQVNCIPINHAMDDCGWNAYGLLLGYRYHTVLGNTAEAARCLSLAQRLFDNSYAYYYDSQLGGGMWYNASRTVKSLYAATLALVGYDLWRISGSDTTYQRFLNIYNGIENNLRREDGLYWIEVSATGNDSANPYDISEGGSCTYIGGNMCMAVLNARLGNDEKALQTAIGMARYETDSTGAYLNDRDAWNNTFFLGLFVHEVMEAGITDELSEHVLAKTVRQIQTNCLFDDGYYSASWTGPKEPSSSGYPSVEGSASYWTGERNRWGTQCYENGMYIGSTPNQIMTSATTAHVLLAAAALDSSNSGAKLTSLSVDGGTLWPVFNPDITSYELLAPAGASALLRFTGSTNASVCVNGQAANGSATVTTSVATLNVTSGDGAASKTYTVRLRSDCAHAHTEVQNASPATCTAAGYTGDTICLDCSETVRYGSVIPANEHTYVDGVCTGCGAKETFEPVSPVLFGWKTDDGVNFSGWTTTDGLSINGNYSQMTGNRRIWKDLLTDQNNFKITLTLDSDNKTSAYFKVLGNTIELDGRGGDGNQLYLKLNSSGKDWITCEDCALTVTLTRKNGGTLELNVANGAATATLTARETSDNLELGLYAGAAVFGSISITKPDGQEQPPEKTPADFGWKTDDGIAFDGWTTTDGVTINGAFAKTPGNHRIWKELLTDPNNFKLQMTYTAQSETSGYLKLLGVIIELDSRGGEGDELNLKLNGSEIGWFKAEGSTAEITVSRRNGGKLEITADGGTNGETKTAAASMTETSKNAEIGLYAGEAQFSNFTVGKPDDETPPATDSPEKYGWQTDEGKTFDGWTTSDGVTITGSFRNAIEDCRIWKSLISDETNFTLNLTYSTIAEASGYVRILGNTIELDSRHGDGNQVFLKLNGADKDWITASACSLSLTFARVDGANLLVTITGNDGDKVSLTLEAKQESKNVELGMYQGTVVFGDITVTDPVPVQVTPADFDWKTDDGIAFDGWTTSDGITINGAFAQTLGNHRIWKELLTDPDNFKLQMTCTARSETSGYLKLLGVIVELDSRGGEGDELNLKLNGSEIGWFKAEGGTAEITVSRRDGGKLEITADGANGGTKTATASAIETSKNAEIGLYAGEAQFSNFTVGKPDGETPPPTDSPENYGWQTDEGVDFSGWSAAGAATISGSYEQSSGNHRIYKQLVDDWNDFYITLNYSGSDTSAVYFKLLGNTIELNCRGGNGNQIYIKINQQGKDWIDATGCKATVRFHRGSTGNLTVTITGAGNASPAVFSLMPADASRNFEIGLYAGNSTFTNITAGNYYAPFFTDVPEGRWYYDTVYEAVKLGLFKGTSETQFEPMTVMTRAMLVTVLYRMENEPEATYHNSFTDVKDGRWYTKAIAWAAKEGIVNGVGNGRFAPNDPVTREQMVVMLYRYATKRSYPTDASTPLNTFADASSVSNWAKTAVSWAGAMEILRGSTSQGKLYILPLNNGTRAEAATILVRFLDAMSKVS